VNESDAEIRQPAVNVFAIVILPCGFESAKLSREYGMERREESFLHAVREGVAGYIVRDASAMEVISAIRAVAAGESVCRACFSSALFHCAAQQLAVQQNLQRRSGSDLSRRELQLIELVCWGLTNKEIASRLNLSEHTVKNHIHWIKKNRSRRSYFTDGPLSFGYGDSRCKRPCTDPH
jgi:DNA-binding CsgD family transcriptional regulator